MRPVDKGGSPYESISDYSEALPYLEERIGIYCSYCELMINHVPEVEHVSAKAEGGDETAWENLLLGCKYCNTRKSKKVTPRNVRAYLWPDVHNTAIAYVYPGGVPKVNEGMLEQLDPGGEFLEKAKNLYALLELGRVPGAGVKDRRFKSRTEAYRLATDSLLTWKGISDKEDPLAISFLHQTIELAKKTGFFSIWMAVFDEYPTVLHALIDAFPGTERTFFDRNGRPNTYLRKQKEWEM